MYADVLLTQLNLAFHYMNFDQTVYRNCLFLLLLLPRADGGQGVYISFLIINVKIELLHPWTREMFIFFFFCGKN